MRYPRDSVSLHHIIFLRTVFGTTHLPSFFCAFGTTPEFGSNRPATAHLITQRQAWTSPAQPRFPHGYSRIWGLGLRPRIPSRLLGAGQMIRPESVRLGCCDIGEKSERDASPSPPTLHQSRDADRRWRTSWWCQGQAVCLGSVAWWR